jgi:hypothetical protein
MYYNTSQLCNHGSEYCFVHDLEKIVIKQLLSLAENFRIIRPTSDSCNTINNRSSDGTILPSKYP